MLIHSPAAGRALKNFEKLNLPPTAEEIRNPLAEWVQMAGVRSPYLAPLPAPFPPVVRCRTWARPENPLALKSKETFHSLFKSGIVARSLSCAILWSCLSENAVLQGPARKDVKEKNEVISK